MAESVEDSGLRTMVVQEYCLPYSSYLSTA